MPNWITTASLLVLTLLSLTACGLTILWWIRPEATHRWRATQYSLIGLCTLGCIVLFLYRALFVHASWQPLKAHVDGLLLIAALLATLVLVMQRRARVRGLVTFALPVLTLLLSWAVCASTWTFEPFRIRSLWNTVHLAGVYLGTLFFAIAAIAGGLFLYVQYRLRHKTELGGPRKLASLEASETLIISTATAGFGLLTLGLVTGLIIQLSTDNAGLKLSPLYWSKVALAFVVWLIYAVVMNVKHTVGFRGSRAAWLSIVGLVLLLVVFGVVSALPEPEAGTGDKTVAQPDSNGKPLHEASERGDSCLWITLPRLELVTRSDTGRQQIALSLARRRTKSILRWELL